MSCFVRRALVVTFAALGCACSADGSLDAAETTDEALSSNAAGAHAGLACARTIDCARGLECVATPDARECAPPVGPLLETHGAATLASAKVWTVVFAGDEALGGELSSFTNALLSSHHWSLLAEYGIGAGRALGTVVAPASLASAQMTDVRFRNIIASLIGTTALNGAVVEPPDANTVFSFILPRGTKYWGGTSHSQTPGNITGKAGTSIQVPYSIVIQDKPPSGMTQLDALTWWLSHELVETATDPRLPGGLYSDTTAVYAEVADLCDDIPVWISLGGASHAVTRMYSQARAKARTGDACVPAMPGPYVGVALGSELVAVPSGPSGALLRLVPFTYGTGTAPLDWTLWVDPGYHAMPDHGRSRPGDNVVVRITRDDGVGPDTALVATYVADPAHPNSTIPRSEWFGGLRPAP